MEYNFERLDLEVLFSKELQNQTPATLTACLINMKWETITVTSTFNISKMSP